MYIVSAVLLFPACVLLGLAWSHKIKSGQVATESRWREYSMAASLIAASCATLSEIGFVVSWFHNGGSPHGMEPSPGTMEDLGSDLQRHTARQRCTGDTWKRETTNIRLRMDSRNPCRDCTDFRIGNGLISRLARGPFR